MGTAICALLNYVHVIAYVATNHAMAMLYWITMYTHYDAVHAAGKRSQHGVEMLKSSIHHRV